MNNGVEDPTTTDQVSADTSMDSPGQLEKGKGKMALQDDHMDEEDDEESSEDEEVCDLISRSSEHLDG